MAAHVSNKEVNWARLEESVRLGVRQLDNLIDINILSVPEAARSDKENRAIGLGVMGFADTIERLSMAYDSEHAWNFADRIFEFISYMAIDESTNLAQERGAYPNFSGSEWSKGKVPIDTLKKVGESRDLEVSVDSTSKHRGLNWDMLREKVRKGMRNATLMAVAPNANIGLVVGTTPGIDARFAQVFSRNKISGKYLDLNHNLVKDLKNMGIWENVRETIIENQGDISQIPSIPQALKDIYKTSFTTSPYAYIEVAARAQKWVDQALSRNMYLETRDIDETMGIYTTAWKKGLKSTYYLHMKPRHTAEQSTTKVNKAEKIGKRGFASVATSNIKDSSNPPMQPAVQAPAVNTNEPVPTPLSEVEIAKISRNNYVEASVKHAEKQMGDMADVRNGNNESSSQKVREMMQKLANHPNASPTSLTNTQHPSRLSKGFAGVVTGVPKGASMPDIKSSSKPKLSPEQVEEMVQNFGKKPQTGDSSVGPEDPGTANICLGCE